MSCCLEVGRKRSGWGNGLMKLYVWLGHEGKIDYRNGIVSVFVKKGHLLDSGG